MPWLLKSVFNTSISMLLIEIQNGQHLFKVTKLSHNLTE